MKTSAQVVETSVTTTDNSPLQDYSITCYPQVQTIYRNICWVNLKTFKKEALRNSTFTWHWPEVVQKLHHQIPTSLQANSSNSKIVTKASSRLSHKTFT